MLPADSTPVATPASAATLASLDLFAPGLLRAAATLGWARPTPVQAAAMPAMVQGADMLATAPTGSGKTAAFVLPLLQKLVGMPSDHRPAPQRRLPLRALVLCPTRELALQTAAVLRALGPPLTTVVAVGGGSVNTQLLALRGGADLVVATPGRLLDLVRHNALPLGSLQLLVLDEADRLLDLGFADELGALLARLPAQRQTWMFSATLPDEVQALANQLLRNPQRVDVRPAGDAAAVSVAQRAIVVDSGRRNLLLRHLIERHGWARVLVFVATQHASEQVAAKLQRAGLRAAALHGQLSAGRRHQVLAEFGHGTLAVLVATDLAARGIDVAGLGVVVNHDLPRSAVDHTHRVGRGGRAGLAGLAVSFILADAPGSEAHFRLIEKRQGQRVPREIEAGFEPVALVLAELPADPTGGVKGRRPSKKDKLRAAAAAAAPHR